MTSQSPRPARTLFRVLGTVLLLAGLGLTVIALADFFSAFGGDSFGAPKKFWMGFAGLPLMAVGAWLLMLGFAGAGLRYVAGESVPVLKDSLQQLGFGGHTDPQTVGSAPGAGAGPFCTACGQQTAAGAKFCAGCGTAQS